MNFSPLESFKELLLYTPLFALCFFILKITLKKIFLFILKRNLKPNCLLTEDPILFIKPSSFFLKVFSAFSSQELILEEHGYKIFTLKAKQEDLFKEIFLFFKKYKNEKFHIILSNDISFFREVLKKEFPSQVKTIQTLDQILSPKKTKLSFFKKSYPIIKWAQSVAESEWTQTFSQEKLTKKVYKNKMTQNSFDKELKLQL